MSGTTKWEFNTTGMVAADVLGSAGPKGISSASPRSRAAGRRAPGAAGRRRGRGTFGEDMVFAFMAGGSFLMTWIAPEEVEVKLDAAYRKGVKTFKPGR